MNKTEAMARIEAIEKEAAELRRIVEGAENPAGLWRPQYNQRYFFIYTEGFVLQSGYGGDNIDSLRIKHGNCFQTREVAEKAAPEFARMHKIIQAAMQSDPDAGPQVTGERVWTVLYDKPEGFSAYGDFGTSALIPIPHVHTQQQAEHMASILNAEGV